MNIQEYQQLRAERNTLDNLLKQLPETSIIERIGLEARKEKMEELLASQPPLIREPVRTRITFRGKPIVGSHGMFAEFGARAINAFADAVAAIGASQITSLGARGAIPRRDEYQLLITGTALGSFGFELEEAPKENMLFPEMSLVGSAIEQVRDIMEASLGTDDELSDAITEASPRAIDALHSFLAIMADQEAVCSIEYKDKVFSFADVGQVRSSEGRLCQDNIYEEECSLFGKFLGVLPKRRTFELQIAESEQVISGKVGHLIEDASEINHTLEKPLIIRVRKKSVGTGRPRYILLGYEEILGHKGV